MKFEVEVTVKTKPVIKGKANPSIWSEMTESFVIPLEAQGYNQAQELAFAKIKSATTFEELMNTLLAEQKGHE